MTYSIVARDPSTGELGVAVQSHFLAVGPVVPWLRAGLGAVATQAMAELSYGPLALEGLAAGETPQATLDRLRADDPGQATRQVCVMSADGAVATHTGDSCIAVASHLTGDGWSVQANMMLRPGVPEAMAEAFVAGQGDLADRMLAALDAAEGAGGDIRGRQSAAMVVVAAEAPPWANLCNVRVDDHPDPLKELRRLASLRRAYRVGDIAEPTLADNPELRFWRGVALAGSGRIDEARELLVPVFAADDRWRELIRRLPAAGQLPDDRDLVDALLA